MVSHSSTIEIACPATDILDFIMDVEAYREIDPRLHTIQWVRRGPNFTVFRFKPRLMDLLAPAPTQLMIRPESRVEIEALPSPNDLLAKFHASLVCVEHDGVTTATRTLAFDLNPLLRKTLGGRLQAWLEQDMTGELQRLKQRMERVWSPA